MKIKHFLPFIFWATLIMILLGLPKNVFPKVPNFWEWLSWDKLVHFVLFGPFCALLLRGIARSRQLVRRHYWITFFVGVFYSGLTEILQHYLFVMRSGNWFDFSADVIGCAVGCLLVKIWMQRREKERC